MGRSDRDDGVGTRRFLLWARDPARTIEEGKRYLGIMPAVAQDAMGLKLVSFYPGNAGTGVPLTSR